MIKGNGIRKKISIILILIAMIVPLITIFASTVPTYLDLVPNKTNVKQGEVITVIVKAKDVGAIADGYNIATGTLTWDDSVLNIVSSEPLIGEWLLSSITGTGKRFSFSAESPSNSSKADSDAFKLTFKVKDDAKLGTSSIKIDRLEFGTGGGDIEDGVSSSVDLTIGEASKPDPKSSNNNLKTLTVDKGSLSPAFAAGTTKYSVTVGNEVDKITVGASVEDPKASVTAGTGNHNLKVGKNTITVTVRAEDGSTKNYVIEVTREDKAPDPKPDPKPEDSSDNNLKDIILSEGKLKPGFSEDNTYYEVDVDSDTDSINIDAITKDKNATITGGLGDHDLKEGDNEIKITVKAEDGSTKDYIINVNKKPKDYVESSDNNLGDLNISDGKLKPGFSEDNTNYEVEVDNDTGSITIDGITKDKNAEITSGLGEHELKEGNNRIVVTVTAEDGSTKDYVINVYRKPKEVVTPDTPEAPRGESDSNITIHNNNYSSNNYVSEIQGLGNLNSDFARDHHKYHGYVGRETTSLDPVVKLEDEGATYRLIGADNLKIGENIVILEVTAANGDVREYEFIIVRTEEENNSLLSALQVGGYAFNPGFREDVNYYTLTVSSDVSSLGVSATPKHGGSLVNIVGHESLNYGVNYIKVSVNGDNGMNTYMVEVIRELEKSAPNILPWIISGISAMFALLLLVSLYFTKRMERKADEMMMREMYMGRNYGMYQGPNNGYQGNNNPNFNQGRNESFVNPNRKKTTDFEDFINSPQVKDLKKEYTFYQEVEENGQMVKKEFNIVERLNKGGNGTDEK